MRVAFNSDQQFFFWLFCFFDSKSFDFDCDFSTNDWFSLRWDSLNFFSSPIIPPKTSTKKSNFKLGLTRLTITPHILVSHFLKRLKETRIQWSPQISASVVERMMHLVGMTTINFLHAFLRLLYFFFSPSKKID